MKKLYREYFYVPENGTVKEKVMLARVTMSIILILVCMAAMGFTAYAYFTSNVSSASITIQSARYRLAYEVPDSTITATDEYLLKNDTDETKTYTIKISKGEKNTAHLGYCKITVGAGERVFYTDPIGEYTNAQGESVNSWDYTFSIKVPAKTEVHLTLDARWGSCSATDRISDDEIIDLTAVQNTPSDDASDDDAPGATPTATAAVTPGATAVATPTVTPTATPTVTPTAAPTATPTATPAEEAEN